VNGAAPPPARRPWLLRAGLVPYLGGAAFLTYFCMYAFRRPWAAIDEKIYGDIAILGTAVHLKTALVLGQLVGYALSKFLGVKICSEAPRGRRALLLVVCIIAAEAALIVFALVPSGWKVFALFLNGLPLGMVWGLVVAYLEGRRASEIMLAMLSCSFIVSSGAVKDVGTALMNNGVAVPWMPAAAGVLFLLPFLLGVGLLEWAPAPTADDVAERVARPPMTADRRGAFTRLFWPGLLPLLFVYFFLTAFRDFRDLFQADLFKALNVNNADIDVTVLGAHLRIPKFTATEGPVTLTVIVALGGLFLIRNHRAGLWAGYTLMMGGLLLLGAATGLRRAGAVDGLTYLLLLGVGGYLAYVPVGSMLFDRLIAATRFTGTAVFAIYLADATGYFGSICVQVGKDFLPLSRLEFIEMFAVALATVGAAGLLLSGAYFVWRTRAPCSSFLR
jgi:hypothetical protein